MNNRRLKSATKMVFWAWIFFTLLFLTVGLVGAVLAVEVNRADLIKLRNAHLQAAQIIDGYLQDAVTPLPEDPPHLNDTKRPYQCYIERNPTWAAILDKARLNEAQREAYSRRHFVKYGKAACDRGKAKWCWTCSLPKPSEPGGSTDVDGVAKFPSDGASGYLWKPKADSRPGPALLTPASRECLSDGLDMYAPSGIKIPSHVEYRGRSGNNGNRCHYFIHRPTASQMPKNMVLQLGDDKWVVPDPAKRYD